MRGVTRVLMVAALLCLPGGSSLRAGGSGAGTAAQNQRATGEADHQRIVGTFRLVTTEVKDAAGAWSRTPNFDSVGYITYSDRGYMGVHIMPRSRPRFQGAQPTADEALAALRGYAAYYGPYIVNDKEKFVIHRRAGQINPGGPVDAKRFYEFSGNRLILFPAPAGGGGKDQATTRVVWERLPNVALSAEARRFLGVRRLLYTDRYVEKGGTLTSHGERNDSRAGSYIIYTPTGHMMVHLMNTEGRTKYAGTTPTPEEALAAYRSYGGYFGRFTVHEKESPPYVIHHQEGTMNPGRESDQQRFYEISGNVLRLGGPPTIADGEKRGGHLYWELLPPRAVDGSSTP